jgi:hypothetical protein
MSYIGANDLVFDKGGNNIFGGGFSVQSIMMKGGMSPILTINNNMQNGGSAENKVSDIFGGLAVPAYAYYNISGGVTGKNNSYKNYSGTDSDSEDDVIDDDLHDKLLGLVKEHESRLTQPERKIKRTRKHNVKNKKVNTRKNIKKDILDVKR